MRNDQGRSLEFAKGGGAVKEGVPSGVYGQIPGGGLGANPPEAGDTC